MRVDITNPNVPLTMEILLDVIDDTGDLLRGMTRCNDADDFVKSAAQSQLARLEFILTKAGRVPGMWNL